MAPIFQPGPVTLSLSDTTGPEPPDTLIAFPGHSQITLLWSCCQEQDLLNYRLYRKVETGGYDTLWTKEIYPPDTSYVDTTAISGQRYGHAVTAVNTNRYKTADR